MRQNRLDLESIWDSLLSRQPERIKAAFIGLSAPDQISVLAHLKRMQEEAGWQPAQRLSAQVALDALKEILS